MDMSNLYQKPKIIKVPYGTTVSGNRFAEKPKRRDALKNIRAYIVYYLNTSTIHGVKYIGEAGRYLIEKLVWLCVVLLICSLCIFLITQTYVKWKTSPVIVSFETKETPIYEIPFPAVTICPEVKMDPEQFNITKYIIKRNKGVNLTAKEDKLFEAAMLLCKGISTNENFGFEVNSSFIDPEFFNEMFSNTNIAVLENITEYRFLGKRLKDGVSMTITEEGICYSINMLPMEDIINYVEDFVKNMSNPEIKVKKWSLEDGYPSRDTLDSYPRRTFLSGIYGGLEVKGLYVNQSEIDHFCEEAIEGFKIILHHPCELPNIDKHIRLPLNQAVFVAIKPNMITVSKELINYKLEDRRCYFAKEKALMLYKIYTQQNCLDECLNNYTLKQCGCVPFWLTRLDTTKICGAGKNHCVTKSKVDYLRQTEDSILGACDCLPLCASLSYDIETSYTNWNWRELFKLYSDINMAFPNINPKTSHFSKLVVYYKDLQFLTSKRHEIYCILDFFSNIGGLLGLFTGFSVISAVEIIYILSLRIICNIKKYGFEYWSGEPQLDHRFS